MCKNEIKFPATKFVHWPGQSVYACETHKQTLQNLNAAMGGMPLTITDIPEGESHECINCINENKKRLS